MHTTSHLICDLVALFEYRLLKIMSGPARCFRCPAGPDTCCVELALLSMFEFVFTFTQILHST